jgi:magnesium-transporting ATPase (P-type)
MLQACYENFAMNGRRVIAFASKSFNGAPHQKFDSQADHFLLDDFTFNGMCAIMDPPRFHTI